MFFEHMTAKERNELDDSDFALVYMENDKKIRKYPIHKEKYVKSASHLFPKGVPEKYLESTARAILRAAKSYGMDTSGWDSLNKYADKHVEESYTDLPPLEILQRLYLFWKECEYGIPKNNKIVDPDDVDFDKEWKLLSPDEFEKYKGGVCWDYVEYGEKYLKEHGFKCKKYFMSTNRPDNMTHTFLIADIGDDEALYYVEGAFKDVANNLKGPLMCNCGGNYEKAVHMVIDEMSKVLKDKFSYYIWEYKGHPPYGCNCETFMKYTTKGEPIIEGEVENNKSLFKESYSESDMIDRAKDIAKRIRSKVVKDRKPPTGNQNCQLCTWCAEANFRGYDVLPRAVYSPRDPVFNIKGERIVVNPIRVSVKSKQDLINKIKDSHDSRYYVHVNWNDSEGGHEFLILSYNGELYIMDAQHGDVFNINNKQSSEYLDGVNYKNSYIVRLDNKTFNKRLLDSNNDESKILQWDEDADMKYLKDNGMIKESYGPNDDDTTGTSDFDDSFEDEEFYDKLGDTDVMNEFVIPVINDTVYDEYDEIAVAIHLENEYTFYMNQIIQEGKLFDQAIGKNKKESILKKILLFLPRMIGAIIKLLKNALFNFKARQERKKLDKFFSKLEEMDEPVSESYFDEASRPKDINAKSAIDHRYKTAKPIYLTEACNDLETMIRFFGTDIRFLSYRIKYIEDYATGLATYNDIHYKAQVASENQYNAHKEELEALNNSLQSVDKVKNDLEANITKLSQLNAQSTLADKEMEKYSNQLDEHEQLRKSGTALIHDIHKQLDENAAEMNKMKIISKPDALIAKTTPLSKISNIAKSNERVAYVDAYNKFTKIESYFEQTMNDLDEMKARLIKLNDLLDEDIYRKDKEAKDYEKTAEKYDNKEYAVAGAYRRMNVSDLQILSQQINLINDKIHALYSMTKITADGIIVVRQNLNKIADEGWGSVFGSKTRNKLNAERDAKQTDYATMPKSEKMLEDISRAKSEDMSYDRRIKQNEKDAKNEAVGAVILHLARPYVNGKDMFTELHMLEYSIGEVSLEKLQQDLRNEIPELYNDICFLSDNAYSLIPFDTCTHKNKASFFFLRSTLRDNMSGLNTLARKYLKGYVKVRKFNVDVAYIRNSFKKGGVYKLAVPVNILTQVGLFGNMDQFTQRQKDYIDKNVLSDQDRADADNGWLTKLNDRLNNDRSNSDRFNFESFYDESYKDLKTYYRFTYMGEGIYEALKKVLYRKTKSDLAWKNFLKSNACSWLPKPPKYGDDMESYFTEKGKKEFIIKTYPFITKHIHEPDIEISKHEIDPKDIVYSDTYQVVVSKDSSKTSIVKDIKLKTATKNDLDQICEWQMETMDEKYHTKKFFDMFRKENEENLSSIKIISYDKKDIGMYQAYPIDEGEWWYIAEIYIIPEYRGRGIGSYLIKKDIDKHDKLVLRVDPDNKRAIKLYESLGFVVTKKEDGSNIMRLEKKHVQEGAWNDIKHGVNPWSKKLFFHLSYDPDLDEKELKPQIPSWLKELKDPEKTMKDTGRYENYTTPRVCLSPSIEGCLVAIMNTWKLGQSYIPGKQVYVYVPEKPITEYKHKTNKEIIRDGDIFDAIETKEMWILEPVKLKRYGSIIIDEVKDDGRRHPVIDKNGKKKKDDHIGRMDFKWHWFMHPSIQKEHEKYEKLERDNKNKEE